MEFDNIRQVHFARWFSWSPEISRHWQGFELMRLTPKLNAWPLCHITPPSARSISDMVQRGKNRSRRKGCAGNRRKVPRSEFSVLDCCYRLALGIQRKLVNKTSSTSRFSLWLDICLKSLAGWSPAFNQAWNGVRGSVAFNLNVLLSFSRTCTLESFSLTTNWSIQILCGSYGRDISTKIGIGIG